MSTAVEIQTLLTSMYSRIPAIPPSRPMPLILKPPKGEVVDVDL
jgi:hypothetical protein